MFLIRRRPAGILAATALAALLGTCGTDRIREQRDARNARINVSPQNYRSELPAALRAYLTDPTNIRDAYVTEPAVKAVGAQNRYVACVRFDAKDSTGRYVGSRDVLAIFVAGRFDQFIDPSLQPEQAKTSGQAKIVTDLCGQADYQRFPELEALAR